MHATRSIPLCLVALAFLASTALGQPTPPRLFTAGAAIVISCPGAYDGIPVPEAACSDSLEGAPGPYVRPYLTVRPLDRLLVTATVGTLQMPEIRRDVYNNGRGPVVVLVAPERTAWHAHATAAYVGGAPVHPVRAMVGAGIVYFHDPIRQELSSAVPDWVDDTVDRRRTGFGGVFTTGILIRMPGRLEGRATYTLAARLATPTTGDGAWRHEIDYEVAAQSMRLFVIVRAESRRAYSVVPHGLSQSTIRGLLPHQGVRWRAAFGSARSLLQ